MMGWSSPNEESRADYDRDARRDAPDYPDGDFNERPRLAAPSPQALECALFIKRAEVDLTLAAQLIEEFANHRDDARRMEAVRAGAQP